MKSSSLFFNFRFLCLLLGAFFLITCDLFNSLPETNLERKIESEIAWATAQKLNVRLDYDSSWGTSNPVRGTITPVMDIRRGHSFTIEFTPDPAYTLTSWLAYTTSSLPDNWIDDNTLLDNISTLGRNDIVLPEITSINSGGGSFTFTINTAEPVTLIPWCKTEPRVTRTEPRDNPNQTASRATDIVIYFNGPINPGTAIFAGNEIDAGIWITAKDLETGVITNINNLFIPPVYSTSGGFFTITISPTSNLPPVNSLITVRVSGLKNTYDESMGSDYNFSWQTPSAVTAAITSWNASYSETANNITVNWTTTGAVNRIDTYYRINKGSNIPLTSGSAVIGTITGIPRLDSSGVAQGRNVSNVFEYEIFIELYADGIRLDIENFKIWNVPDMSTSKDNPLVELTSLNISTELKADTRNYVLIHDITLSSWTPVGPFSGKFYGNGRTITSGAGGLFGSVNNALIRDLLVEYTNTTISETTNFGGITGEMRGTSRIENSIVSGTIQGSVTGNIGGIVGRMIGGTISNCYSTVAINNSISGSGQAFVGGIAGRVGDPATAGSIIIQNTKASGNITVTGTGTGNIYIGGICGASNLGATRSINFRNVEHSGGNIIFTQSSGSSPLWIGGFAGYISSTTFNAGTNENCNSRNLITVNRSGGTQLNTFRIGGFVGELQSNITRCYSATSIEVNINTVDTSTDDNRSHDLGGFSGRAQGSYTVSECYATGSLTIISTANETYHFFAGGFSGTFRGGFTVQDSYATGSIMIDRSSGVGGAVDLGGFTGSMRAVNDTTGAPAPSSNKMIRCFSTGSFTQMAVGTGSVGGLLAFAGNGSTIEHSLTLGEFIAGQPPNNAQIFMGRVSANFNANVTYTNNYAINTIKAYVIISGDIVERTWEHESIIPAVGHRPKNGTEINRAGLVSSFWRGLGYDGTNENGDAIWNLGSPVTARGWPTLRNAGGQQ